MNQLVPFTGRAPALVAASGAEFFTAHGNSNTRRA